MRGKVECEEADVAGSFEGMEMIAHHRLTLSGTARVGGTVRKRRRYTKVYISIHTYVLYATAATTANRSPVSYTTISPQQSTTTTL